ncbi:hypothetical protein [Nigerium massiliense]|uniref:hypothetical protein n=1 Tax=Nigerium massiliense TaxID=1522317 RepID=UPI00059101CC|nr:hypothetical protein [Nigerium massiliense]
MPKIPAALAKGATALVSVYGATVVTAVVNLLNDPQKSAQARELLAGLTSAARKRTAEGRLAAKIDVLNDELAKLTPGDPAFDRAQGWKPRLAALETKRTLVLRAYTGRQRSRQLRAISDQVDALLLELLQFSDDTIAGETTTGGDTSAR